VLTPTFWAKGSLAPFKLKRRRPNLPKKGKKKGEEKSEEKKPEESKPAGSA